MGTACGADARPALNDNADLDAQVDDGILNGRQSLVHDFPATGALLVRGHDARGKTFAGTCTGTLIAPDVVLTAAHCTESAPGDALDYFFSLALDVTHAGLDKAHMPKRTYAVRARQAHPDYNGIPSQVGLGRADDLALVYLASEVSEVAPAAMLTPALGAGLHVGQDADIAGYGARHLPLVDNESIVKMLGKSSITELGAWEIAVGHVAGGKGGGKCFGDSGGPTYVTLPEGVFLAGVTSHVYGNDFSAGVSAKFFAQGTIDERVDARFDWITQTMHAACREKLRSTAACSSR